MSGGRGKRFDWRQMRQRVETALSNAEAEQSPADIGRILKERALALAEPPPARDPAESIEVIEFQLAQERYAIETRFVREIHPLDNLTPIPCTPVFVRGVVNIRGEILSVVDIKKFFSLPERGISPLNQVIVLETGRMVFGILADHVTEVRHVPLKEMNVPRQNPEGIGNDYIRGITASGLAVLDARAVLMDPEIIVQ